MYAGQLDSAHKVLIVNSNKDERMEIADHVKRSIRGVKVYESVDGRDAMARIDNDAPKLVIVTQSLLKVAVQEFAEWMFKRSEKMALIVLGMIPDTEFLVDEVVLGKVHFVEDFLDGHSFSTAIARAMTYVGADKEALFSLKFLSKEDVLLKQGDKGEYVYIVKSGKLHAMIDKEGEEKTIGEINPGEFVGEMAYINGEPRSATVVADSDCELIEIPNNHLDHILFQKPAWSKALLKTLSTRLKKVNVKEG